MACNRDIFLLYFRVINLWRGDGRGMHEYMKKVEIVRWKILTEKKTLGKPGRGRKDYY
jgi:hypothetical protein